MLFSIAATDPTLPCIFCHFSSLQSLPAVSCHSHSLLVNHLVCIFCHQTGLHWSPAVWSPAVFRLRSPVELSPAAHGSSPYVIRGRDRAKLNVMSMPFFFFFLSEDICRVLDLESSDPHWSLDGFRKALMVQKVWNMHHSRSIGGHIYRDGLWWDIMEDEGDFKPNQDRLTHSEHLTTHKHGSISLNNSFLIWMFSILVLFPSQLFQYTAALSARNVCLMARNLLTLLLPIAFGRQ